MPPTFDQTLRALRADRSGGAKIAIAVTIVLAVGWAAWMGLSEVPVYRTSLRARLEVLPAPSHVASPVAARVVAVHMHVGDRVAAGEVLVELDAQAEHVAIERAQGQLAALDPELSSLEREIAAEANAISAGDSSGRSAVREQLDRQRAADVDLAHAEDELARNIALVKSGVGPAADVDRSKAEVAEKRASRDALGHAADSLTAAERERDAGRRLRSAELERQRAEIGGAVAIAHAEITRLELEIERHMMRAPVAGALGSIATLQPGAFVASGDAIATIVPDGTLQIVADYGPTAIGRLAPGQAGRIRLDGFPWTRWGTVPLRVTRVANEVRDDAIRVELAIEPGPYRIPLAHGMTGTVDVEVERASPAALVLRSIVDRSTDEK